MDKDVKFWFATIGKSAHHIEQIMVHNKLSESLCGFPLTIRLAVHNGQIACDVVNLSATSISEMIAWLAQELEGLPAIKRHVCSIE